MLEEEVLWANSQIHAQEKCRNLFNNSDGDDLIGTHVCYLLWLMWCDFWLKRKLMAKIISSWPSQRKHTHTHILRSFLAIEIIQLVQYLKEKQDLP